MANDVSAPGENIYVATINNQYECVSGTSFSSPCVAALVATMKSIYPDLTREEIDSSLKNTASPVRHFWDYYSDYDGKGIVQFCDALNIQDVEDVQINLKENIYDSPQPLSLSCADENATILYTLDATYPDVENGIVYESPLEITDITRIRAVTYYKETGYYGTEIDSLIRIRYLGDESDFKTTEDGIITDYTGDIGDLIVPETINGIIVKGFESGAFNSENTYGISLPSTITEIPKNAFSDNTNICFVEGKGVLTIGDYAFNCAESLMNVSFPNATEIGTKAFAETYYFESGDFSRVEVVGKSAFEQSFINEFIGPCVKFIYGSAFKDCNFLEIVYCPQWTDISATGSKYGIFYGTYALTVADYPMLEKLYPLHFTTSNLQYVNLPSVKTMGIQCFYDCTDLTYVYMPSLTNIPKESFAGIHWNPLASRTFVFDSVETVEEDAFGTYKTERIEFSNLKTTSSLPQTEGCIIAMPSTFAECTEDTTGRNYKVYGTGGTYAEQWAKDSGHTFIEISQETAILKDVPMEYTGNGEILSVDVIGFNRTYQWYGNTEANNTTGTPIDGATSKDFNPADYPESNYYYCVITSTDKGYDPIEIRTGITENKTVHIHTEEEIPAVAPTCTEIGLTAGVKCSECGEIITEQQEIPALGHDYNSVVTEPTCTEQGYTTYTCECGDTYVDDYIDVLGHSYTSEITTPATHTTEGIKTFTCSCGDTYTVTIEKLAEHNHQPVVTAPTCTKHGYTTYTCECGDNYVDDYVNATGHADNDGNGYCDECSETIEVENSSDDCVCGCHQTGIKKIIYIIVLFFQRLFGLNKTYDCGVPYY